MLQKLRKVLRNKKGQGLVEYAILIGGVALVCLAAVALLGHKTNDIIALVTGVLPGAHTDDNGPILSGKLVATSIDSNGGIGLDLAAASAGGATYSLGYNLGLEGGAGGGTVASLVVEAHPDAD